jgi:hypothetical protein
MKIIKLHKIINIEAIQKEVQIIVIQVEVEDLVIPLDHILVLNQDLHPPVADQIHIPLHHILVLVAEKGGEEMEFPKFLLQN